MYKLREIRRAALSLLLPNRCPFCDGIIGAAEYWCDECYGALPFLERMPSPTRYLDGVYSCCEYKGRVVEAVHRMKNGLYSYAPDAFAVLMTELSADIPERIDMVTSVPCSFKRRQEIGYDHAARIANDISHRRKFKYRRLLRVTDTKREQKKLSRSERFENARNSYKILDKSYIFGKNILLVDDVSTTGATLSAIAAELKAAGAARVYALTFAKVSYSRPSKKYFIRMKQHAAERAKERLYDQ